MQSLESGALEGGKRQHHSPKDILVETSLTSLRRAVSDGDALGSLPVPEADCQRKTSISSLSEINSQERFLVYSEDQVDIYPVNSTPVHNPEIDIFLFPRIPGDRDCTLFQSLFY